MPGTTPPTSQLDWLISTTAMIVLLWSRATRDLLKSFGWGIAALHRLHAATKLPRPRRPPHSVYRSPKGEPLRGSKPANRQQATVSKRHPSDGGPIVRIQYPPAASHTYPSATSGFLRMTQSTRLSHSGPDWHRPDSAESGHPRALDAGCVISDELSPGPTAYLGSRPLFAYRGWQDPSCVTRPRRLLTVLIVFRSQTVLPVVMPTTVSPHSGVIVMAMVVVGIVAPMVIVYGFSLYLVDIWLWATTATA